MLSNGFDTPLRLTLKPSKIQIKLQLFLYVLALTAILFPNSLPLIVKVVLLILLVVHFVYMLITLKANKNRQELLIWRKSSQELLIVADKESSWNIKSNNLVTPWFVVINLESGTNKRTILILKDQCDTDTFRRLKVRLKYYQGEAAIPTDAR